MTGTIALTNLGNIANALFNSVTANSTAITALSIGGATVNSTSFAGTANNATNLAGVAAASYQLNSTLAANVATMAANSATFANSSVTNTFTVGTAAYFVSNGSVGIGTASPAASLDVTGTIRSTAAAPFFNLVSGSTDMGGIYSPDTTSVNLLARSSRSLVFMAGGTTERMRITAAGLVGIGTNNPTERLFVSGGNIQIDRTSADYSVFIINNTSGVQLHLNANGNTEGNLRTVSNHPLSFSTNNTERMRITAAGDVGIGTSSPGAKLDVSGVISASGSSIGSVVLNPGSSTNPGYIGFFTAEGTRRGYIGWASGTNLLISSENGWNYNFSQAPLVSGSIVLHAGNYNSYAPTLTGTGASGNWGINITGNAATVTNGVYTTGDQTIGGTKNFNGSLRNIVSSGWSNFYLGGEQGGYLWMHIGGDTTNELRFGRVNRSTFAWESNPFVMNMSSAIFGSTGEVRTPIFRLSSDTNSYWQANEFVLRGGSPTIYFRDTDHNSAMLHCNSNLLYVLRGGNDTTSWSTVRNGNWPVFFNLTNNDLYCGGDIYAVVNVVAYASDKRLKENIKEIPNAIEKIKRIRGVTFDWSDKIDSLGFTPKQKYDDVGVIAQEIEEVMPQVVSPAPFDVEYDEKDRSIIKSKSGENYKTVQYERVVPLLIQAIKEQQAQIEELQAMIMEMRR